MTTLEGRPNTALLVIETQNAVLAAAAGRDGEHRRAGDQGRTAEVVPAAEVSFSPST